MNQHPGSTWMCVTVSISNRESPNHRRSRLATMEVEPTPSTFAIDDGGICPFFRHQQEISPAEIDVTVAIPGVSPRSDEYSVPLGSSIDPSLNSRLV